MMPRNATGLTISDETNKQASHIRASPPLSSVSRVFSIPELLSMVFLFCITKDDDPSESESEWDLNSMERHQYPNFSGKEAPLLLTHICRQWRQTALNTPRLWACMQIRLTDEVWRVPWLKGQISALRLWMKRSQPVPISVILTVGSKASNTEEKVDLVLRDFGFLVANTRIMFDLRDLVKELVKHAHRWEKVSVFLPRMAISAFLKLRDKDCRFLKALELREADGDAIWRRLQANDLSIRSAPKLEELSLEPYNFNDYVVVPDGISAELRALQLSYTSLRFTQRAEGCRVRVLVLNEVILSEASFARFPSAFPLLEELTIEVPLEDTTVHNNTNRIGFVLLEKLTTLRLSLSTEDYFPLYLITAPMLKHLTVKDDVGFDDDGEPTHPSRDFEDEILNLLRRSRGSVASFHYLSDTQISDNITMMLNEMPDLVKLHIESMTLPASALEALKSPLVCPRLTMIQNNSDLHPGGGLTSHCGHKNILQLIKARCRKRGHGPGDKEVEDEGERAYITELAFPLHDSCEREFRKNKIFREADVVWRNTRETSDLDAEDVISE